MGVGERHRERCSVGDRDRERVRERVKESGTIKVFTDNHLHYLKRFSHSFLSLNKICISNGSRPF